MAKDPILPLYYNDICRTTSTWTDEEFGAYMRLLIEQWDKKFIPSNLARLSKLSDSIHKHAFILAKFKEIEPGKLQNENMEDIRRRRKKFSKIQTEKAGKRWGKKDVPKDMPNSSQTSTKKMPSESESELEEEIEFKGKGGLEGTPLPDIVETYFNDLENSREFETIRKDLKLTHDQLSTYIEPFRAKKELSYPSFPRFASHFKNWVNQQIQENGTGAKFTGNDRQERVKSVDNMEDLAWKVLNGDQPNYGTGGD